MLSPEGAAAVVDPVDHRHHPATPRPSSHRTVRPTDGGTAAREHARGNQGPRENGTWSESPDEVYRPIVGPVAAVRARETHNHASAKTTPARRLPRCTGRWPRRRWSPPCCRRGARAARPSGPRAARSPAPGCGRAGGSRCSSPQRPTAVPERLPSRQLRLMATSTVSDKTIKRERTGATTPASHQTAKAAQLLARPTRHAVRWSAGLRTAHGGPVAGE